MSLCLVSLFGVTFEWIMFLYLQAKKGFFEVASLENLFVPFIFFLP